ncbi:MAG TPA: hypothetical protein VGR80_07505 [Steroidobacteraceae bacterium]|nr:hypothetical protein [Steroidobacteraceae bacterium]
MSISSLTNPTALLSQVTGKNPFAVATPFGASSFVNTLLQELRQAGAGTTAGTGTTAAAGALQAPGHSHGHHGGMSQLVSLLQQSQASGSGAASAGGSSLQLQALLQNLKNAAAATPWRLLSTAA